MDLLEIMMVNEAITNFNMSGISCEDLVQEFGSPLYVYNGDIFREKFNLLKNAFDYPKVNIYYACKSNTNINVMKIFRELGSKIDTVSPGEIFVALKAGFGPEDLLYTPNNPTLDELKYASDRNVMVTAGSLEVMKQYARLNGRKDICVRVNPDIGFGHHNHCITGGPGSKFGIYFNQMDEAISLAASLGLEIKGIHAHIGSGILKVDQFIEAMDMVLKSAGKINDLDFVDFGGGIGVPYRPEEAPFDLEAFGIKASEFMMDFSDGYGSQLEFNFEPGKYLTAEAGYLLITATNKKETPSYRFVGTDSGFNHLIRPILYGSYHHILNCSNPEGEPEDVLIAGNICESGDLFTTSPDGPQPRKMPEVRIGDILAITNAGSYGFAMSSNYNSRPRPAEVLVEDGKARLIRKRETFEDLIRNEIE
jgi:diaminopimelate decarboxylase